MPNKHVDEGPAKLIRHRTIFLIVAIVLVIAVAGPVAVQIAMLGVTQ